MCRARLKRMERATKPRDEFPSLNTKNEKKILPPIAVGLSSAAGGGTHHEPIPRSPNGQGSANAKTSTILQRGQAHDARRDVRCWPMLSKKSPPKRFFDSIGPSRP